MLLKGGGGGGEGSAPSTPPMDPHLSIKLFTISNKKKKTISFQSCLKTVKLVTSRIRRRRALKTDGTATVNALSPRVFLVDLTLQVDSIKTSVFLVLSEYVLDLFTDTKLVR